jgi:hypothetical protein
MAAPPAPTAGGENWKEQLNLPPKDTRIQTEVWRNGEDERVGFFFASGRPRL